MNKSYHVNEIYATKPAEKDYPLPQCEGGATLSTQPVTGPEWTVYYRKAECLRYATQAKLDCPEMMLPLAMDIYKWLYEEIINAEAKAQAETRAGQAKTKTW